MLRHGDDGGLHVRAEGDVLERLDASDAAEVDDDRRAEATDRGREHVVRFPVVEAARDDPELIRIRRHRRERSRRPEDLENPTVGLEMVGA